MNDRLLDVGGDFGDYRIVKLLGTSGRTDVYLARSITNGKFFAIKTFMEPDGASEDFGERLSEVVTNVMNLRSDSIVQVRDSGIDPKTGLYYLITDYVDGGTLAEHIAINGPLEVGKALKIALGAANALEVIHAAGMVHGGITPGNIMFMRDGTLKLTDAGMSKASPAASVFCVGAMEKEIPPYVAPEQVLPGAQVDSRADVYALGVVLFEMLTGKRIDAVPTILDMIVRSANSELVPDVRSLRSDVPAVVADAVAKLCAPKADERVQSAGDAAQILVSALKEMGAFDETAKHGADAAKKHVAKLRRSKVRVPKKMLDLTDMSEESQDEGGGLGKIFVLLVIIAMGVASAYLFLRKDEDPEETVQELIEEVEDINDSTVRSTKSGDYTWFYTVEHSKAVLWRGTDGYHGDPCLEPNPTGRVVVPDKLDGFAVGALGSLAFHDCTGMTEIVLPASLERIGNRAFILCRSLKEVVLPPGVKALGKWAFNSCSKLRRIDISNCEEIADDGGNFSFCPELEEYAVAPENTKFKVVGGSLYSADGKRFLAHPAKCERIVEVPEGVEEIGAYAFCESQAETIVIPSSVARIGQGAFKNCRAIRTLSFAGDAPEIIEGHDSIFANATTLLSVAVKKNAEGWPAPGAKWPARDGRHVRYLFPEVSRQWRDAKGRAKEATLVGIAENGTVAIMLNPGEEKVRSLTISKLSGEDQEFISRISGELRKYEKRNDKYEPVE